MEADRKRSQAAPPGETQTMTVVAPEGHRAKKGLLAQVLVQHQQLLQERECQTIAAGVGWIKTG